MSSLSEDDGITKTSMYFGGTLQASMKFRGRHKRCFRRIFIHIARKMYRFDLGFVTSCASVCLELNFLMTSCAFFRVCTWKHVLMTRYQVKILACGWPFGPNEKALTGK